MTESNRPLHVPVLASELLTHLDPIPGQVVVDATGGAGGHSALIAGRLGGTGKLLVLDRDPGMLALARQTLTVAMGPDLVNVEFRQADFADLPEILQIMQWGRVDAVVADLGFCSDQLADPQRGLSFQQDGPLDMRLNPTRGQTAAELVRRLHEKELADIFWQFGEERYSRRIARRIVESRKAEPIVTTGQLADLVRRCVPRPRGHRHVIDPATRVFQALRIAVNDELGSLERLLQVLPDCLKPGAKAAIISFHSLEDRLVKRAFREREVFEVLTKKPLVASDEEASANPRSRSAKLRLARRKNNDSTEGTRERS